MKFSCFVTHSFWIVIRHFNGRHLEIWLVLIPPPSKKLIYHETRSTIHATSIENRILCTFPKSMSTYKMEVRVSIFKRWVCIRCPPEKKKNRELTTWTLSSCNYSLCTFVFLKVNILSFFQGICLSVTSL